MLLMLRQGTIPTTVSRAVVVSAEGAGSPPAIPSEQQQQQQQQQQQHYLLVVLILLLRSGALAVAAAATGVLLNTRPAAEGLVLPKERFSRPVRLACLRVPATEAHLAVSLLGVDLLQRPRHAPRRVAAGRIRRIRR